MQPPRGEACTLQRAGLNAWGFIPPRHEHTLLLGQALLESGTWSPYRNREASTL